MVVAVPVVRVVESPADEVVDVVAVRHGLVTALGAVSVGGVAVHGVGVAGRMRLVHRDHVLVHVLVVGMVQVAVVQVVDVIAVTDGGVTTAGTVAVLVGTFVDLVGHGSTLGRSAH